MNKIIVAGLVIVIGFFGWVFLSPEEEKVTCQFGDISCLKKEKQTKFETISVEKFKEYNDSKKATLLDIRTIEEYNSHRIGQDTPLLDFYQKSNFKTQLKSLDKDKTYLIYCNSGNRTASTLVQMQNLGFKEVYDLNGGIQAWKTKGYSIER